MNLFSKLKDYNIELEEILDNKYFSSNTKNLLLNMIYKIEISYRDFYEVKRCVRTKDEILREIIETIKLYCDNIKTVEPDSDQAKMLIRHKLKALTNERERSILTYPTEIALLYAISDISPKYFYIDSKNIYRELIQNSLVNGYNMNNIEILKDFNGWSWDISEVEQDNYIDNLIYQNLLVMLGERFLYEWRTYNSTDKNFVEDAQKFIKIFTSNDKFLKCLYKVLYLNSSGKEKENIDKNLKLRKQKLKKMENKVKFLEDCKTRKINLTKKIDKIDLLLNDKELLAKRFVKVNLKLEDDKKIETLRKYKNLLIKEKEKYLKEISEIAILLKPSNFIKEKSILEETTELYNCKENLQDVLIDLQKEYLYFIEKKLSKMKTRDEIVDIVYELRYYSKLKLSKDINISDIEILQEYIDKILKKAITKLCKIGAMKIISMDINLNFEIIKYALDTKIINLEEIKICLILDKEDLVIKVYDKDVFEKQGKKKLELSKNIFEVAKNRKIKIFN